MAQIDTHTLSWELFEAVFSLQSVPSMYNEGRLPLEEILDTEYVS
jgi:hypothetical protein